MKLVYLSPLPWDSFTQRPHEFVEYFHASTGGDVLWINPYPTRLPRFSDLISRPQSNLTRGIPNWIKIITPIALPIEPIPFLSLINYFFFTSILDHVSGFIDHNTMIATGKPSFLATIILARFPTLGSIYDAMDDFPEFYTGIAQRSMTYYESKMSKQCHKILVSSHELKNKFSDQHSDVQLVLNGYRSQLPMPIDRAKNHPTKVIGYIGTIAQWFDWELVLQLAVTHPNYIFRLIGPQHCSPPQRLPSNIELCPAVNHADAIISMQQFDVGLIPFKQNYLTKSVDPIKYYEYRALGLPVLSTSFGEMIYRGEEKNVFLFTPEEPIESTLEKAISCTILNMDTQQFRQTNSWQSRFESARLFTDI